MKQGKPILWFTGVCVGILALGAGAILVGEQLGNTLASEVVITEQVSVAPTTEPVEELPLIDGSLSVDRTGIAELGEFLPDKFLDGTLLNISNLPADDLSQQLGYVPAGLQSAVNTYYDGVSGEFEDQFGIIVMEFDTAEHAAKTLNNQGTPFTETIDQGVVESGGGSVGEYVVYRDLPRDSALPPTGGSVIWTEGQVAFLISGPAERLMELKDNVHSLYR